MSLSTATTDAAVIEGLTARVTSCAAAGQYGANRRRSFGDSRAGRRNRERLQSAMELCLAWYRYEGSAALSKEWAFGSREFFQGKLTQRVRFLSSRFRFGGLSGVLLSLVAGWILDMAIDASVSWLLSPASAAWRAAVEGET